MRLLAIHLFLRADTSCSLVLSMRRQYSSCIVCLNVVITNLQYSSHNCLGYWAAAEVRRDPTRGS